MRKPSSLDLAKACFRGFARCYHGVRIYELCGRPLSLTLNFAGLGLFAHLNIVAALSEQLRLQGRPFAVRCTSSAYADGPGKDWFSFLFEDLDPPGRLDRAAQLNINRHDCWPKQWRGHQLTLASARAGFFGKYRVREEWTGRADVFVQREFGPGPVLGIHYRGTDKDREAPRVTYDEVLRRIRARVETERYERIFLATDESGFVDFLRRESPLPVITRADALRSSDGRPLHLGRPSDGLRKAGEAVVDFLLLARCRTLIKTASALSGWAALHNPLLEVEFINPPYAKTSYFPDSHLARLAASPVPAG